MGIKLEEGEGVIRDGERYSIGDKVYGVEDSLLGVGYIEEIEVLGVHFGFRAKVDNIVLDEPKWYDARSITHEPTLTNQDLNL